MSYTRLAVLLDVCLVPSQQQASQTQLLCSLIYCNHGPFSASFFGDLDIFPLGHIWPDIFSPDSFPIKYIAHIVHEI